MKDTKIAEAKAKLLEINELIKQLDESIRQTAIQLLVPLYFHVMEEPAESVVGSSSDDKTHAKGQTHSTDDLGEFIASSEHGKPADNVLLLAAWLYSQYGVYPISTRDIQDLGGSSGSPPRRR